MKEQCADCRDGEHENYDDDVVLADPKWSDIHLGQNWRNKATGRVVIVLKTPPGLWGSVQLLHQTGRKTSKQAHYFIYDYELITTEALLNG